MRYTILDPTGLEDLILVSDRIDRQGLLGDQSSFDRLAHLLDPFFQIGKVLSGSELTTETLWPITRILDDERAAFVLEARQDRSLIAFLYFERMSLELHVPEQLFLTGATDRDRASFHRFLAWADALSKGIGTAWSVLEIAGDNLCVSPSLLDCEDQVMTWYYEIAYERVGWSPDSEPKM